MVAATDAGQVREANEDCLRILPACGVAVLADGMGGHRAGDIASRMAVKSVCEYIEERSHGCDKSGGDIAGETLINAFNIANGVVYLNACQIPECEGMGTTLIAGTFQSENIFFGHIGDSRIYSFYQGNLTPLTTDHTLATELSADTLNWELPAYSHHVLRKALGIESRCSPDFFSHSPRHNEIILMCSDGLTGIITDHDIENILALRCHQPEYCLETLINCCLNAGAPDNVSIVLVYICSARD